MSKDNYDFNDIDAILAEFRDADVPPAAEPERGVVPSPAPQADVFSFTQTAEEPAASELPEQPTDATVRFEPGDIPALEENTAHKVRKKAASIEAENESAPADAAESEEEAPRKGKFSRLGRRAKRAELPEDTEKPAKPEKPPRVYTKRRIPWIIRAFLSLVFAAFTVGLLGWAALNLHPASDARSQSGADTRLRLSDKLDVYVNNAASDALGELTYIRKMYTIQESATVAPEPDPNGFGMTYDPADIEELIQKASVLLDGQKVVFDPTADFVPDEPIRYYLDDTILVIAWKEYIEQRCCTFAEVKIAHGSQIRRKLAEDSYSSSVQLYASDMAEAANAVVAMNGDFYAFRDLGITAYQRKVYRNNPAQVDSCFFTASGDMLFSRAGELMGPGEAEAFIEANDVLFAVAFGPILVDNGELQYCSGYPIGEVNTEYSRSVIAMTDELHYLLMTINHTPDARPRATINELARTIYSKNVWKAYTLDGGQTAEIIMMGGPINHVDFGFERAVSDIIYFATAIPEEVRS